MLAACAAARLDDVGVERALDEEAQGPRRASAEVARDLFELADEQLADDLALGLGVGRRPPAPSKKRSSAFTWTSSTPNWRREGLFDLLALVLAHEPGVDEDAGELVADGLGDERRGDRRVDAARERAEHPVAAHLRADPRDLVLDDRGVRPGRRDARRRGAGSGRAAPGRARCGPPRGGTAPRCSRARRPPSRRPAHSGDRGRDDEALGRRGDRVAVAHPRGRRRGPVPHQRAGRRAATSSVRPYSPTPVLATSPPSCWAMSCAP